MRNRHACKTATMFDKNDYGGGPVLCQGSEQGAGTNRQIARRVLRTIGSGPVF